MAKNIVPRQNKEGSLGTKQKRWQSIYADDLVLGSGDTSSDVILEADIGSENNPSITYDVTENKWVLSSDGMNYNSISVDGHKHDTEYINKTNTIPYVPTENYNPATKKYVDDKNNTFIHNQETASKIWTITHNLNRFPSVTIVDSTGREVIGDIKYIDRNTITLTFKSLFSGRAYLN
jgi:hypothetical protein